MTIWESLELLETLKQCETKSEIINLLRESRLNYQVSNCELCRDGVPRDDNGSHYLFINGKRQLTGPCDALEE